MAGPTMAGEKTRHFKFSTTENSLDIITVATGAVRKFDTSVSVFSPEMIQRLVTHAIKQKLSDDAAAFDKTDEKITVQAETYQRLLDGKWSEGRASGVGGLSAGHTYFAAAAAAVSKQPLETIIGHLLAMDPDTRATYVIGKSKHPKIAAHLAAQTAERAKAKSKELSKETAEEFAL